MEDYPFEDSVTEQTDISWFSRIGSSLSGILVGLLLFMAAFPLLFWNEGRAVRRYKTLQEGGGATVSISAESVQAANDGKLVHLAGEARTDEILADESLHQGRTLEEIEEVYVAKYDEDLGGVVLSFDDEGYSLIVNVQG